MKNLNRNLIVALAVLGIASIVFSNLSQARNIENKASSKATADSLCVGHLAPVNKKKGDQSEAKAEPVNDAKHTNGRVAEGRMLFYDRGCIVCHTVRNRGGRVGPSLDGLGKRHDRQYVAGRINDAEFVVKLKKDSGEHAAYAMPPSGLTKSQADSLADYIMTLP